ncbi:hypothetical protein DKX38_015844 [Salix brachista]|uniref:GDSL esterase/lipase n=1 Tax=Salix brachista TaxID=2182728 RepID=A0A5N5L8D5_9ROSI|nr:hypothetical protein DKX38_015844 [Salix brachista]
MKINKLVSIFSSDLSGFNCTYKLVLKSSTFVGSETSVGVASSEILLGIEKQLLKIYQALHGKDSTLCASFNVMKLLLLKLSRVVCSLASSSSRPQQSSPLAMSRSEIMEKVTASSRFITGRIILVACKENYEGGSSWNIWCSYCSSFCSPWRHYFCVDAKVFGNIFHSKLEIYTMLGFSPRPAMVEVLMLCSVSLSFLLLFQLFSICENAKNTELVPALYIFGDSTVDAGNNNNLSTTARADSLPYGIDFNCTATGRFTNGMTVADYFARFLGLPFAPPYMNLSELERRTTTTGLNFASAASGILPETGSFTGSPLTLDNQTDLFKMTAKTLDVQNIKMHLARSIFFISTGSNDYIMNYRNIASKMNKLFSPDYFAKSLTEELVKRLKVFLICFSPTHFFH